MSEKEGWCATCGVLAGQDHTPACDREQRALAQWLSRAEPQQPDYATLQARLAACEADARRYRFLRENANPGFTQSGKPWGVLCAKLEVRTWPQIDAAIDSAISAGGE